MGARPPLSLAGPWEGERQELVEPVRELARQSQQVHAMFNNCYEDQAVRNARQFQEMLGV